jgi:hypothetical protein
MADPEQEDDKRSLDEILWGVGGRHKTPEQQAEYNRQFKKAMPGLAIRVVLIVGGGAVAAKLIPMLF